ncbi:probable aquaporin NIP7-1 [Neltuma alba]|uniref:probable aquaporin NIP7-1 n=1 Tax=Neltuma alba TaxID=207710 RepID=UPI0010A4905B|nr:probable aquaporin NIP7-1 [Prosopis alba]
MKKIMIEKQPSLENFNDASSSTGLSSDDKEIDCTNAISKQQYILVKNSAFHSSLIRLDLNYARTAVAEMVGTFILMFCVCGIIASTQSQNGEVGLLEYAATAGLTVVVVIFSIGPISCAHVNPAATIAFATFGQFPWLKVLKKKQKHGHLYTSGTIVIVVNNFISFSFPVEQVPVYILAQTVGSVLATYIGSLVYGIKSEAMMTRPIQGPVSAFWVELIATFIIMFLAAALTSEFQSVGHLSGFVVGIAIGLAVLITGPVSGGSMNPARSLGPAILSWKFKDIWIYITAPISGAVAGVLLFRFLRLKHQPCTTFSSPAATHDGHSVTLYPS